MRLLGRLTFLILGLLMPWILILLGLIFDINSALLYVGAIIWFGLGVILTAATYE